MVSCHAVEANETRDTTYAECHFEHAIVHWNNHGNASVFTLDGDFIETFDDGDYPIRLLPLRSLCMFIKAKDSGEAMLPAVDGSIQNCVGHVAVVESSFVSSRGVHRVENIVTKMLDSRPNGESYVVVPHLDTTAAQAFTEEKSFYELGVEWSVAGKLVTVNLD